MPTRRQFIQTTASAAVVYAVSQSSAKNKDQSPKANTSEETTFIIVSDTHYSSVDENHPASLAMVNTINSIANGSTRWPTHIEDKATGFSCAGKVIAPPQGIVHLGDMTDFGSQRELDGGSAYFGLKKYFGFRQFWEHDAPAGNKDTTKVNYPVHCALGNHDIDSDPNNRRRMIDYIKKRHEGQLAPVPVVDFDKDSLSYALHWGPLRILQLHRFATDSAYGRKPALPWLQQQLHTAKQAQQPVLLCQHYGFDHFGKQSRWWTDDDREQLLDSLDAYDNIIGLCHGHSHASGLYRHGKLPIFRCNNMGWELNKGNKDGHGTFALVHATKKHFNLMHIACLNAAGEGLVQPDHWLSMPINRSHH